MISRRRALIPIAAAMAAPAAIAAGNQQRASSAGAAPAPLPERYDEPLGIGLEGWAYPAPVRWRLCTIGGQNLRMAYMDIPPASGAWTKAVVLLHGKSFDSSYWAGPIRDLTRAGFRVIVPDQIGFHKSSKPDIPYAFDLLAEQTVNLLGALQISHASVIGHSTGAMLAVRLAASYPQKVDRLILEAPIGLVDYRRFIPPQSLETLIAAERRRTIAAQRVFIKRCFPLLPAHDVESFVEWRMRVALSGEFERFCKASALISLMVYRDPVRGQCDDIRAPTLIIVGDKDQAAPLSQYASPDMAAKMPTLVQAASATAKEMQKGSVFVAPGVGHVPHLEAPDAFRQQMLTFLSA